MRVHRIPFFILTLLCFCHIQIEAQDIISTKDGKEIKVKIQEISKDFIRYENYATSDGISFSINRALVSNVKFDQEGNFVESGYALLPEHPIRKDLQSNFYLVDGKILNGFFALEEYMLAYQPSKNYFIRSRNLRNSANLFGGLSIASFVGGVALIRSTDDIGPIVLGGLSILLVMPTSGLIGIVCKSLYKTNKRKALDIYGIDYFNASALSSPKDELMEIHFGVVSGGVGLQLNF